MQNFRDYGIDPALVERLKKKAKKQPGRERVKRIAEGVTKMDLQNAVTVRKLIGRVSSTLGEPISPEQQDRMTRFIVDQEIDPNNALHMIKLYAMFRKL
ncbi:stage VI sporulation protein F [Paenibacillus chartarius]|uniref:Stage VI sporulation protein F n=1 Tax=Paenibacillus chartarius TaxID=747481 RepID=A0ABV6DTU4_9BACL